jgi:hypothetical protein
LTTSVAKVSRESRFTEVMMPAFTFVTYAWFSSSGSTRSLPWPGTVAVASWAAEEAVR